MKKIVLFTALAMATGAMAEPTDTLTLQQDTLSTDSFTTSRGKTIVVNDNNDNVTVNVFKKEGTQMTKLSETTFADGQEISQVYVTSPFMPTTWGNSWSHDDQRMNVHMPLWAIQCPTLMDGAFSMSSAETLHPNSSLSYSWQLGFLNLTLPFNKRETIGMGVGFTVGYTRHGFDNGYTLSNVEGKTVVSPITTEASVKKSYLSYWSMRLPVLVEYQPIINGRRSNFFVGAGLELEYRLSEHARYKLNDGNTTTCSDININPLGVNLNAQVGYSGLMAYISVGLTPLLKTSVAPKAHTFNFGIAVSL